MKESEVEKYHVHKVAQLHNCSIERVLEKYVDVIDEKSMIPKSELNNKL